MFDETSMTAVLAELRYLPLKKMTYKASWSSVDVEHFLFFSRWGGGKYLSGEFGLRNVAAERFAIECQTLFAWPLFRDLRFDVRYSCSMRFSLGMLADWPTRSSLATSTMSAEAVADKVKFDVQNFLFPSVRSVLSTAELFSFLVKDIEPSRWFRASGALRAAKIVHLGRQLGVKTDELRSILKSHLKEIGNSIGRSESGEALDPSAFIEKVLHHSELA